MIGWFADHIALVMFLAVMSLIFTGLPVAMVLGGVSVLFGFIAWNLDLFVPLQFYNLVVRMYGGVGSNQVLVAIPMFIFMGTILERSGIADDLLRCLQIVMRRVPGGLAMSVTLMGTIMAATTGIVGASVVMLTLIAMPALLKRGYSKELASGTIASAGTLGILILPSIMLIIMGDLLSVPIGVLFAGAVVPGLILSGLYIGYIGLTGFFAPHRAPAMLKSEGPGTNAELFGLMFKGLFPPTLLVVLVLGSIFMGLATPTEASGVGCAGALALAAPRGRLGGGKLGEMIRAAALTNAMVFFITLTATAFAYIFRALGGDDVTMSLLVTFGIDTPWRILVFMLVLVFLLGFFFDWLEICLIVLPIFAPILQQMDFSDYLGSHAAFLPWLLILVSINLQTSFLTPPFGFALFYMKGVVPPDVGLIHIYRGIIPFVLLQLTGLLLAVTFPEIVLWLPRAAGLLP
jgi:tripartite ATP-independent transporter DctM subunit